MACPFFLPRAPLAGFSDLYGGECAADAMTLISVDTLRTCCNHGYARDVCARAAQSDSDAFRFAIKASQSGVIDVAWSSERNHHPVAVGILRVSSADTAAGGGALESQARVYAAAYLRQVGA